MRAAAILGLGSSTRDLLQFQHDSRIDWTIGLPGSGTDADVVLILGGDGTVHRHLRPLVKLARPVLVVPSGSGNDFAHALRLNSVRDSLTAWRAWAGGAGNVRTIDLGVITPLKPLAFDSSQTSRSSEAAPTRSRYDLPGARYFCCVGGCGLDREAAHRANQMPRWMRARGGYALALLVALARFQPVPVSLEVPEETSPEISLLRLRPAMLLAFANAPSYGGGMRIAPRAELDDGKLDVCVVNQMGKLRLACLFPTVYFGKHLKIGGVEYFRADRLRVETETPVEVYADGEYVCRTPVEVSVSRLALQVVIGDGPGSLAVKS